MPGKDFIKQLHEAQTAISKMNEKLETIRVEFSSGGGMVTVTMNGKKELVGIKIDPQVINANDPEMLQDLIISAVNGASARIDEQMKNEMGGMLTDMGIKI